MELSQALKEALRRLLESGPVKVQENGSWLAPLENFLYEVREKAGATVLHLWTQEGTLVRRVIAIDANDDDRLALQVKRFGRTRPDHLEFVCRKREPGTGPLRREQFRARFSEMLAQQFPDETVSSLTSSPDLEHSLSGNSISASVTAELHEYDPATRQIRRRDPQDTGNVKSRLVPRREIESALAQAREAIDPIRRLNPEAVTAEPVPGNAEVALRFRGLLFGRSGPGGTFFGIGSEQALTPATRPELERLLRRLDAHRSPFASSRREPLYRAQPERWLGSLVITDPARIDPHRCAFPLRSSAGVFGWRPGHHEPVGHYAGGSACCDRAQSQRRRAALDAGN